MRQIFLFLLLSVCGVHAGGEPPLQGEINGAPWTLLIPAKPTGTLLIFAHGFRPQGFPNPADLELGKAYAALLDKGWIIAATGYRATGLVVKEGADDVDQLRDLIGNKFGPVKRCYLHGESMGGTIVTLLAQRDPVRYQGAVAVGAALDLLPESLPPKIPLLFLTNRSELTGPQDYVQKYAGNQPRPALWRIERDGHVNVNQAEILAALEAIAGKNSLTDCDATIQAEPGASVATLKGHILSSGIQKMDPVFGNLTVSLQVRDLKEIGIRRGDIFTVRAGGQSRNVVFGKEYADVPEGHWVAFENADGWMQFAINLGNAARDFQISSGKTIQVEK